MYTAAAMCMWFLRAWKIGEIQRMAVEREKRPENFDPVSTQLSDQLAVSPSSKKYRSGILKQLFAWKKV